MGDWISAKCIYQLSTLHKDAQALALRKLKPNRKWDPSLHEWTDWETNSIPAGVKGHHQFTWEGFFAVKWNLLSVILKEGLRWLGKENNRRALRLFTEGVCLNVKEHFCCSLTFPNIGFTFKMFSGMRLFEMEHSPSSWKITGEYLMCFIL